MTSLVLGVGPARGVGSREGSGVRASRGACDGESGIMSWFCAPEAEVIISWLMLSSPTPAPPTLPYPPGPSEGGPLTIGSSSGVGFPWAFGGGLDQGP